MFTTKNLNPFFRRVFKINDTQWVYSDGNVLLIEADIDDDIIRLREATYGESEKILERLKEV